MKLAIKKGTTSKRIQIFIQDSSATDGSGLTGLVFNSAGLTAYYLRDGAASPVAITLVTATVGTWASGGFKEIGATNMPGWYELGIPNAALAAGAGVDQVGIQLKGATDMAPCNVEIQLKPVNANIEEISDDATAADNLEKDYDGTGYQKKTAFASGGVYYKGDSGISGTTYPNGEPTSPVNSFSNANDIMNNNKISTMFVDMGGANRTLGGSYFNKRRVIGIGGAKDVNALLTKDYRIINATFINLRLKSTAEEVEGCHFIDCNIVDRIDSESSRFTRTLFEKNADIHPIRITVAAPAPDQFILCSFLDVDMIFSSAGTAGKEVYISRGSGKLTIKNVTHSGVLIFVDGFDGEIIIDASCTTGTLYQKALNGKITNNGSMTVVPIGSRFDSNSLILSSVQAKASDLALSNQEKLDVNAEADQALADYDPPTRAEATSDKDEIITEVDANETKIDAVKAKTDNLPADPASVTNQTNIEAKVDTIDGIVDLLNAYQVNEKRIEKRSGVHYLVIYDSGGFAGGNEIVLCPLKDFDGTDIADLTGTDTPSQRLGSVA